MSAENPQKEGRNRFREGRKHPRSAENPSEGGSKRNTACQKEVCGSRNRRNHSPSVSKPAGKGENPRIAPIPERLFSMNRKPHRRHCRNRKSCRKTALHTPRTSVTPTRTTTATRTRRTRTPTRRTITRSMTTAGMIIRLKQPANSVAAPHARRIAGGERGAAPSRRCRRRRIAAGDTAPQSGFARRPAAQETHPDRGARPQDSGRTLRPCIGLHPAQDSAGQAGLFARTTVVSPRRSSRPARAPRGPPPQPARLHRRRQPCLPLRRSAGRGAASGGPRRRIAAEMAGSPG